MWNGTALGLDVIELCSSYIVLMMVIFSIMFFPVSSAVYQGGLFGVCGMMPQRYTGAVMTGQVKIC